MSLDNLTREQWIGQVQRVLLDRGWTGDSACEMANGLAEIFEWRAITPDAAIARAEWCSRMVKL